MSTLADNLLPDSTGRDLGSSSARWDAFIQNLDLSGTTTITGRFGVKNLEDIRFADQYTGTVTQMLDAAIADVVTGLVVAPSTMGAGSPTTINSSQFLLDLRSGVFKLYCGNTSTPQLNVTSGGVAAQVFTGSNANPASAGLLRLAKIDALNFRNNANSADINGLSLDSSDIVQIGGAAGAKTIGPMAFSGAVTGITSLSYSGIITSTLAAGGSAPFSVTSTTVVPNLNVATLNGVTVSGAPTTGQSLVATGATTAGWSSNSSTYKFENYSATPSAGATPFSWTVPVNELAAGQSFRVISHGVFSNGSTASSMTIVLKNGATTLATVVTGATGAGAITNTGWRTEFIVLCSASGSSGTVEVSGIVTASISLFPNLTPSGNTATVAFDTTVSAALTLNISATNSGSWSARLWTVERLG